MSQNTLLVYKPCGSTPLDIVRKVKANVFYQNEIIGYAGRLDPMAEGLLLLLIGQENKKRKEYERLDKEYEFEVLFGVSTDSYDVMGKIVDIRFGMLDVWSKDKIIKIISSFVGKHTQEYPPYSSPRVKGKPLFWWAREGRLHTIEIPKKEIEIFNLKFVSQRTINGKQVAQEAIAKIEKVNGEFRQKEIIEEWRTFEKKYGAQIFPVCSFKILCSSGTYVRSIAHEIGEKLKVSALAFSIKRTKIGEFTENDIAKVF